MAIITVTESGTVAVSNGDTVVIDIPGGGDVTIVADPNSNVSVLRIEFVNDAEADAVTIDLATFSADNLHLDIKDYDPTDSISLLGATNTHVDPGNTDEYLFDYVGADGQVHSGYVRAKDKGEKDFTSDPPPILICFAAGTMIRTTLGPKRVEDLREWDCVETVDSGFQPIKWIGRKHLSGSDLAAMPQHRPIRVAPGALGHNMPTKTLTLSPNHRVLAVGWKVQLMFGIDEVLVPIKALVNGTTIRVDRATEAVDYYHILLDDHQLVYANDCVAETLLLADQSLKAIGSDMADIDITFEELETINQGSYPCAARPVLKVREALTLVSELSAVA